MLQSKILITKQLSSNVYNLKNITEINIPRERHLAIQVAL